MRTLLSLATLLSLVGGCSISSLDDDVTPTVTSASVELSESPESAANVRVDLRLEGGPSANRRVVLAGVELREPPTKGEQKTLATLKLKFPSTFEPHVGEDQVKMVTLENDGTLNGALQAFCNTDVSVLVKIGYADDANVLMYAQKTVRPSCTAR